MPQFLKTPILAMLALVSVALTGCLESGTGAAAMSDEYGTVVVKAKTGNVDRLNKPALGKASAITLDSLIVTAVSNATSPDTVTVRLAVGDSGFGSDASVDQDVAIRLDLKALRSWAITAKTKDANDSVIQLGTANVLNLLAGEIDTVTLSAQPLVAMYKAKFNFPDSIFSQTGVFGQKINLTLIELLVDGVVVVDSASAFAPATNHEIAYDYVSVDADSVTLKVYGTLQGASPPWNSQSLLYSATRAISSLSTSSVNTVSLPWRGPSGGVADLTVQIGKVGTYELEGGTADTVLARR